MGYGIDKRLPETIVGQKITARSEKWDRVKKPMVARTWKPLSTVGRRVS